MDDDLATDTISVSIALAHDSADLLLSDIIFVNFPSVMGNDYWLAFVTL